MPRILVAPLLVALLLPAHAPARTPAEPVCGPAVGKTLTQGRFARVYVRGTRRELRAGEGLSYACLKGRRRQVPLEPVGCFGVSPECVALGPVAVAGPFVAYGTQTSGGPSRADSFSLSILDIRSGKVRRRFTEGVPGEVDAVVNRVVLRPTGAAAWLWTRRPRRPPRAETTVVSRSACGPTTVAESPEISPQAFWRNGPRVFWRRAGRDESAALCGRLRA